MSFAEALAAERNNPLKARRLYLRANLMMPNDWYARWERGLASEVNLAIAFASCAALATFSQP